MTKCPYCSKSINLGTKANTSIKALAPGELVRIKCPSCSNVIRVDRNFQTDKAEEKTKNTLSDTSSNFGTQPVSKKEWVKPPEPPDISWLKGRTQEEDEQITDDEATLALVLVREKQGRESIVKSIEEMGYRVELVDSSAEAIDKMAFHNYAMVALHSRFEGSGINTSSFHQYMKGIRMATRRYIFYFLIGPEFKTLYELQALVYSANLVVNDKEVSRLDPILMKKIPEYEKLFGQIIEEIRINGKII